MSVDAIWQSVAWPGLEHVTWSDNHTLRAESRALHVLPEGATQVMYIVSTDRELRTRQVTVGVEFDGAYNEIELSCDADGTWSDRSGERPDLHGCVDVDIATSPLTNTLPIRRLGLAVGHRADLRVVYVNVPSLQVTSQNQHYTALWRESSRGGYRYESGTFRADLTVDGYALVTDYPELWKRRPSS